MRKTFESIQAWRRAQNGSYPGRIIALKQANLISNGGAICPSVKSERPHAVAAHRQVSSRRIGGDPAGTYEYELTDTVLKSGDEKKYLPADAPAYTRQDVKAELLRRPFFYQVPILRCSSHRESAPASLGDTNEARRNLTVNGAVYWSPLYWEQLWVADVPYCARDANVLFGLKGPPFHSEKAPELAEALDLRPWTCAFGDVGWWWTYPIFGEGETRQRAANLRPFFEEKHGRIAQVGGTRWWIDGLVQLQGRILTDIRNVYREPGMLAFAWERTALPVNRLVHRTSWLQGTVWAAPPGDIVGWLVWRYSNGLAQRVPLIYGQTTARFWADPDQINAEKDFPGPVWQRHDPAEEVGRDRSLRIYEQTWENPHPGIPVATLDFVSNRESPAAPFILSINVYP